MCLKFREEITNPRTLVKFSIDDNFEVVLELAFLAFNIKQEVCDVLESFVSFLKNMKKEKVTACKSKRVIRAHFSHNQCFF
jgi:hypothetical protein